MLNPGTSNVSQQLGFAIRLTIDLAGSDSDEDPVILSTLHKIVYCLENNVCGVLVRPTSLPEPSAPLTFSTEEPLELLCTLYRIQASIRKQAEDNALHNGLLSLTDEMVETLHPNIRSTLWETRLMLEPSTSMAMQLISAYSKEGYVATFPTPHWVHKAANIIVKSLSTAEGPLKSDLVLAYGNATSLLGKWSGMWEAASILLKDIEARIRTKGSQK